MQKQQNHHIHKDKTFKLYYPIFDIYLKLTTIVREYLPRHIPLTQADVHISQKHR